MIAYYAYASNPLFVLIAVILLIGILPLYPYNRGWGYSPVGVLLLVLLVLLLVGCAKDAQGNYKPMTPEQKQLVQNLEMFALSTAVSVGTQYAGTGNVDTGPLISNTITQGAALLEQAIKTQAPTTPTGTATVVKATFAQADPPTVVTTKVVAPVADQVAKAVAAGVPPATAGAAAASGLKKGAKQIPK